MNKISGGAAAPKMALDYMIMRTGYTNFDGIEILSRRNGARLETNWKQG